VVAPVALEGVDLFRELSPQALDAVAVASGTRTLQRGDLLFEQGDTAEDLFVVRQGRVAIATRASDGRESLVYLMEPGDLFGEMSLFDGRGRSARARALEPSELLAVPFTAVRGALASEPTALWKVVELLAGRLRAADEALSDSVFLDVAGRTAKRLIELSNQADEFTLPLTQEELAGLVGASRERVNKAIASFVRLGWLEQSDRQYRILERDQLARRAR
jgi:CRP/FNR family cyclic AMP-dependent transcriptional regulator